MATQRITPTEHEKREWSRMATDAYKTGRNAVGHRYSMDTTRRHDASRVTHAPVAMLAHR